MSPSSGPSRQRWIGTATPGRVRRLARVAALTVLVVGLLAFPAVALAVTWTEVGDAGDLPSSAQVVTGEGPVTSISGTLSDANDEDMYALCLVGGKTFSARTHGSAVIDPQLFLFDAAGLGVYANDDDGPVLQQSALPAGHALTPTVPGIYYLAISAWNNDPVSSGGRIFPDDPVSNNMAVGPTGPGGSSPISGWTNGGLAVSIAAGGGYTITLTGAEFVPAGGDDNGGDDGTNPCSTGDDDDDDGDDDDGDDDDGGDDDD
jgi:hypothetical protein